MVSVPNCTSYYQPLDLMVNKSCKDFLGQEAKKWYFEKFNKQMAQGKRYHEIKVGVRLSVIKALHAKRIVNFYDYNKSKSERVCHGWQKFGIAEKLKEDIILDLFK